MTDLLRAIDFFTQNLHVEQIFTYGFHLFDEMIHPKRAVLYVREGDSYLAMEHTEYAMDLPSIPWTQDHDRFAVRNGFVLGQRSVQLRYFEEEVLEELNVSHIMPLIAENRLVGFVFMEVERDQIDVGFITRFNNLMNLALEKAFRFDEQSKMMDEINTRLFNLHSLSHTTRLLLAELDMDKIYQLCIDVVRELTSSSVTTFGVVDETGTKLVVKGYQDIVRFGRAYVELQLKDPAKVPAKVVYNLRTEMGELAEIIENPEVLSEIYAEYIVLLTQDKVLGFVTIGEPVGTQQYDGKLLQQIESIAGLMHIALINARRFETITRQKERLEIQTSYLQRLNRALKNINSAESIMELSQIALDTLHFGFGITKAAMLLVNDEEVTVAHTVGFSLEGTDPFVSFDRLNALDETYAEHIEPQLLDWLTPEGAAAVGKSNSLVLAPVRTVDWEKKLHAVLAVFETAEPMKEEQVLVVETMANSTAPVIRLMKQIEETQEDEKYILDAVQVLR